MEDEAHNRLLILSLSLVPSSLDRLCSNDYLSLVPKSINSKKLTQSIPEKVLSIVKMLATSLSSLKRATLAVASLLF